jgi:hypothetical protein
MNPEARVERVERVIPAEPAWVFGLLCTPQRHSEIDGSSMVRGLWEGPDRLTLGSRFSMSMRQGPMNYRSISVVVEFDPDRRIAWTSQGCLGRRRIVGGQRWRYELFPDGAGTLVIHSYVWGYAALPTLTIWLPGYPRRMRAAMTRTLERLAATASHDTRRRE